MSALSTAHTVSLTTAIRRFAVHFLEMCIVMCAGGAVLNIVVFGAAVLLGNANLVAQAPELSILIIAVDLTLAMAGYMALRGHPVRHNLEMSGSTIVGGIVLIGALWAGMFPQAMLASWPSLFSFMCGPLCLIMLVVMAVRFEHYGGRVGTNGAVVKSSRAGEYTCSMHPEVRLAQLGQCPICGMRLILRQPLRT
jgi:heavy metal-binding protein